MLRGASTDERGVAWAWNKRYLDVNVTRSSLDRALRIMDALIKGLEKRGFPVEAALDGKNSKTKGRVGEEVLAIRLHERTQRVERKAKTSEPWLYPRYDFRPTGDLTLRLDSYLGEGLQQSWSDGKQQRLEQRLNDFVVGLVAGAESEKQRRLEREMRERQWKAAEQRRLDEKRRQAEENARVGQLETHVALWVRSGQIREFAAAVWDRIEQHDSAEVREESQRCVAWALAYADRLDPLVTGEWKTLLSPAGANPTHLARENRTPSIQL